MAKIETSKLPQENLEKHLLGNSNLASITCAGEKRDRIHERG